MSEPITFNGRDIEAMDRDELLAAMRELAPHVSELAQQAESLRKSLEDLRDYPASFGDIG